VTDLNAFEQRAAVARSDAPPTIDVTGQVMSRLEQLEPPSPLRSPFIQISAASALAAAVVLAVTLPMVINFREPVEGFFVALSL
jgi:hypothetical protein